MSGAPVHPRSMLCPLRAAMKRSKEVRAEPFAAQIQGGNVYLIAGPWHREYLDELEQFPRGKFRDQVDASTGAFNRLVGGSSYNLAALAS